MKISHLRTLLEVAETGSLVKAADRLNTVQPAISRQIRLLEEDLGIKLFTRHGRGMAPTEAGLKALDGATRVLAEVEQLRVTVCDSDARLTGRVSIGMPPAFIELLAVPLARYFQDNHPAVEVQLLSRFSALLRDGMQHGEIDLALTYEWMQSRAVRTIPLLRERLYLVGPADAGLSTSRSVPLKALQGRRLILPPASHSLAGMIEDTARKAKLSLDVKLTVESYPAIRALIQNGFGWTVWPLASVQKDVAEGRLSAAPIARPVMQRQLVLATPSDRRPARAVGIAVELIRSEIVALNRQGTLEGTLLA